MISVPMTEMKQEEKKDISPFYFDDGNYELFFKGTIYDGKTGLITDPEQYISNEFLVHGTHIFTFLRGSFAIVIKDIQEEIVYAARDRFGIKPLFYKDTGRECQIAYWKSDLLKEEQRDQIKLAAMQHYFSFQYVPIPLTTTGIKQLQPGHFLQKKKGEDIEIHQYFKAELSPKLGIDEEETVSQIRTSLTESVSKRLSENERIGVFLSGGIDSSVVAAIAKEEYPQLCAISVEFGHDGYSELDIAKETADKLGLKHICYTIHAEEFKELVSEVVPLMNDPIADPSCIPLYVAGREAKKHVDVILSGEGADELFGGYNIYREHESLKYLSGLPSPLLRVIQNVSKLIPEGVKGKSYLFRASTPLKDRYIGNAKIFEEDAKKDLLYTYNPSHPYTEQTKDLFAEMDWAHPMEQMQYIDLHTWLPGNILTKAHMVSHVHDLDVRMPFLDEEVFNVAKNIPVQHKIKNNTTKYVLREAAKGIAPDHVIEQRKLGFPVPLRIWLKDELYDWAIDIINNSSTGGVINKDYALHLLEKHVSGRIDYSREIWTVLIFMLWYEYHILQCGS